MVQLPCDQSKKYGTPMMRIERMVAGNNIIRFNSQPLAPTSLTINQEQLIDWSPFQGRFILGKLVNGLRSNGFMVVEGCVMGDLEIWNQRFR